MMEIPVLKNIHHAIDPENTPAASSGRPPNSPLTVKAGRAATNSKMVKGFDNPNRKALA